MLRQYVRVSGSQMCRRSYLKDTGSLKEGDSDDAKAKACRDSCSVLLVDAHHRFSPNPLDLRENG